MKKNKLLKLKGNKNFISGILLISMFFLLCFINFNQVKTYARTQQKSAVPQDTKTAKVEQVHVSANEMKLNPKTNILVLMNAKSQLMVDGEFATVDNVSEKLTALFTSRINSSRKLVPSINNLPQVKVVVQKDIASNKEDYEKMVANINSAIYNLRDSYSNSLFNKSPDMLSNEDMLKLDKVVEPKIYVMNPKSLK